jgi:hypothetical protein
LLSRQKLRENWETRHVEVFVDMDEKKPLVRQLEPPIADLAQGVPPGEVKDKHQAV